MSNDKFTINDKLLIATRIKKTIIYVEDTLDNYPHKNIEIKKNISSSLYEMLKSVYLANVNCDREYNQNNALVMLQMVDFYLLLSYKKKIISQKKFEGIIKHLDEISKMITGWKNFNNEKVQ